MRKGDQAPDFELPDQNGNPVRLSSVLEKGPVVLFFYPLAMSGGCTQEVCHFRDLSAEFAEVNASPLGVSKDSVERQSQFTTKTQANFPLLSDSEEKVITEYGVKRRLLAKVLPVKRSTFIIGRDRSILEVISSETDMRTHADKALEILRAANRAKDK